MKKTENEGLAINSKILFATIKDKKIAYRSIGSGKPLILLNRFRGNLDTWDPLFLDSLAKKFNVITFDPSGFASSTGTPNVTLSDFANDVKDLAEALNLKECSIGGWSFGGMIAQVATAEFPELFSHLILIGTNPPGQNEFPIEEILFEVSRKLHNDLADEEILFFEPKSEKSKKAALESHNRLAERKESWDSAIAPELWNNYSLAVGEFIEDKKNYRNAILESQIPILVLSGDHDLCFPVENWFALSKKFKSGHLIVSPQSGHGPQHQFPELFAKYIIDFVEHI